MVDSWSKLVKKLDSLGFFIYAPEGESVTLRDSAVACGDLLSDECGRVFFLDAEEVYESGPGRFLAELAPFLEAVGCPVTEYQEIKRPGEFYTIVLNGRHFELWSLGEGVDRDPWLGPSVRLLGALEALLDDSGSDEHVFFDVVGNDTMIVFLTEEMQREIEQCDVAGGRFLPVLSPVSAH